MNKHTVFTNMLWRFAERSGAQLVSLVVSLILARLLMPDVYGQIALVNVFLLILNVFVDSGLANALIQKKNADDLDFSSVFYANMVFCITIYIGIYIAAPYISAFYRSPDLVSVIRVMGWTIIISGIKNVQQAYVSKNMLFKKFFFSTLGGTVMAAIVGIALAYKGFGIWALVIQSITNNAMDTLILWINVRWRPKLQFSWNRLKSLFSYGWKILAANLLDTLYTNLSQLIIGKKYTSSDLAYYNRGNQFPILIVLNINSSIDSVLMPSLSQEQEKINKIKAMTKRTIKTSSFLIMPLMIGLCMIAPNLVRLLLTDKWIECVPYMRVFCFIYMLYPLHTANLNSIKALGRSDIYFKIEIIKKVLGSSILLAAMHLGVWAIAFGVLIGDIISYFVNAWPNKKLIGYSVWEQIKDVIPNFLIALIMGGAVYCIQMLKLSLWLTLIAQILFGAFVYVMVAYFSKNESLGYFIELLNIKKR